MKESHLRSLIKAISWRLFGTLATMVITYFFTHKINVTIYIGLFEFTFKIGLFYLHERLWNTLSLGIWKMQQKKNKEITNKEYA